LPSPFLIDLDKPFDGAIVGFLHIGREKASGKFSLKAMISYTLTAHTFLFAWFIGTVTFFLILLNVAVPHSSLRLESFIRSKFRSTK
jgi:hypothetical protein